MARKRVITTKYEIIQVALEFFLEKGVSATSPKMIAEELNMSTGNITYYFPNKDHLLAVLAEMLCDFQWKLMEEESNEGLSSVIAICLELAAMAAMCEENEIAKDFYIALYTHELCLETIQRNDAKRARKVFRDYCPDWTEVDFAKAETIVSGIEYATLRKNAASPPLEQRVEGALSVILTVYGVPEEIRKQKVQKVLSMDYRQISRRVFAEFKDYVAQTTERTLDEITPMLRRKRT